MENDQERIKRVLKHFNISQNELSDTEPFSEIQNNANTRRIYGVDQIMKDQKSRKVRIIIDYDADFPEMIIRIFSKCSQ